MNLIRFPLRLLVATVFAAGLAAVPAIAHAHSDASGTSAASGRAVTVSMAAPAVLLSTGAVLGGVAVQTAADGTVWVLERASDGARASVRLLSRTAAGLSVVAGTVVVVTALSTGWLVSAAADGASRALAFVPNEVGAALLRSERISR